MSSIILATAVLETIWVTPTSNIADNRQQAEAEISAHPSLGAPVTIQEYIHSCPACLNTGSSHYCSVPSLFNASEFITYERCNDCGVVFRNPRLPSGDREDIYLHKPVPHSAKVIDPVNQAHYAYMIRLLKRLQPSGSGTRLLDFGCGGGQFLVEAQAEGFDVSGLEINRDLANFVTDTYTFPVFRGLLNDPSFGLPQFDLILSSQVFEHLSYPREILERLVKHLNSPGLILIEVPNLLHIRERLRRGSTMDDSHLVFFSKDSLSGMMESVGLEIIKVQEGMRLYRRLSGRFAKLPDTVHDVFISTLGRLRVRTGLSVIGVKI